jgi:hypothetical protein
MGGLASSLGNPNSPSPSFMDRLHNFWESDSTIPQQSKADTSLIKDQSSVHGYDDVLQDVAETYPALAPHTKKAVVYDAAPPKGNTDQLETYLPWEDWNPHPGKVTSELYRPYADKKELRDAIAGDLIHLSGAIDPKTNKPVDPDYYELKKQVKLARNQKQKDIDYKAYKEDVKNNEETRSFSKWFHDSRSEAYVRGRLFPDKNDNWKSFYEENPKLRDVVDKIGKYLKTGKRE